MEIHRESHGELKSKDIGFLMNRMRELSMQMDYHFKFDDDNFWQALEENINISEQIKSKSRFEKLEYFKSIRHLRDTVQEAECYEDIAGLNHELDYFKHCFLKDIPQNKPN